MNPAAKAAAAYFARFPHLQDYDALKDARSEARYEETVEEMAEQERLFKRLGESWRPGT